MSAADSGSGGLEGRHMAVITVENLRYRYPHTEKLALDGLTFSV